MTSNFNYPLWNRVFLDRSMEKPIHEQLFDQLRQAVVTRAIPKGARLPPTRMIADELAVSRSTATLVYDRLIAEGYATARKGAGTYVATCLPEETHLHGSKRPLGLDPSPEKKGIARRGQALRDLHLPSERAGHYDLSPTTPALDKLPFERFGRMSSKYWRSEPWMELGYGERLDVPALRFQVAHYLGEVHGVSCSPQQILIVSSTTQAYMLVAHCLLDPGDGVIIEDPNYPTRIAVLTAAGLRVIPVPVDRLGLNAASFDGAACDARLVIASPTNQFPSGSTMPLERRAALVTWAQKQNAWILEYDYNNAFRFDGRPLSSLSELDGGNRVLYLGNFNKIISPALGLAYLVVPPDLVEVFARAKVVFSCDVPPPLQNMVADFMEQGDLAAHIRRMRLLYADRAASLTACLRRELGEVLEVPDVTAGLHLTTNALVALDAEAITDAARLSKIDVPALSRYQMSTQTLSGFIFGFGNSPVERIEKSVRVFADIVATRMGT